MGAILRSCPLRIKAVFLAVSALSEVVMTISWTLINIFFDIFSSKNLISMMTGSMLNSSMSPIIRYGLTWWGVVWPPAHGRCKVGKLLSATLQAPLQNFHSEEAGTFLSRFRPASATRSGCVLSVCEKPRHLLQNGWTVNQDFYVFVYGNVKSCFFTPSFTPGGAFYLPDFFHSLYV